MPKLINLILALAVAFGLATAASAGEGAPAVSARLQFFVNQTLYLVNGEGRTMDVAPIIRESRTLLPVRFVAEPLGSTVAWDGQEQKVTVNSASKVMELRIGKAVALVNGATVPIDPENPLVTPIIYRNRTMLPLRFVAENLEAAVQWNPADSSVTVVRGEFAEPPAEPPDVQPPGPAPAVITYFTANPGSIGSGGTATLSWQVLNATAVTLDGAAAPATGTKTVLPAATATYTLTATGATGSSSSTKTVIVTAPAGSDQPGSILVPTGEFRLPLFSGGFTGSLQPLMPGNAESEPEALPGDVFSNLQAFEIPKTPLNINPPQYVRVYMDSLYCVQESKWDHGSTSDEPYLIVTGFNTHKRPKAWAVPSARFGDMDSGDNGRITDDNKRLVFEGEAPSGATIGFNVLLWEADECGDTTPARIGCEVAQGLDSIVDSLTHQDGFTGDIASGIGGAVGMVLGTLYGSIQCLSGGGGDDLIANETVTLKYDSLRQMARGDVSRAGVLDLNGGDAGHYNLRWHIEFDRQAGQSFPAKYTNFDYLACGDVLGDGKQEIVIADGEAAPGNNGKFYIYSDSGALLKTFEAVYTDHDRVAAGDVIGDGYAEIIVASDDDGGKIAVYNSQGLQQRNFAARFTKYDGLAVANVLGDARDEILVACGEDKKVYIYSVEGALLKVFGLGWGFDGCRCSNEDSRSDAFLAGDVMGDGYAEIVMIDQNSGGSKVHVYNADGAELCPAGSVFFTPNDGVALGDLKGDARKELIITSDPGDGRNGCLTRLYNVQTCAVAWTRSWPLFTRYDGFTAGDVLGTGKDQIILATEEDSRVFISK